jgi:hypothetical protein
MRLAEFCGQTEYPAVCYLHCKLLLREQIACSNETSMQFVVVMRSLQDR